jgi:hypothetical protein
MKKIFLLFLLAFSAFNLDAQCTTGSLELKFDNYPSETSWRIKDYIGAIIYQSGSSYYQSNQVVTIPICLNVGQDYVFEINDSYGDGICCTYGEGYYKIKDNNGLVLAEGGAFSTYEVNTFCFMCISSGPTCSDGIQNGNETDIDCGGSCLPCSPPPSSCNDGIQNGDETGVDCGGSCSPCPPGGPCFNVNLELRTDSYPEEISWKITTTDGTIIYEGMGYTQASQIVNNPVCLVPGTQYIFTILDSYGDGICCNQGQGYYHLRDIVGNTIIEGGTFTISDVRPFCFMCPSSGPTCTDGIQNGNETGIDCGGSCASCPTSGLCETPLPTILPNNQAELAIANSKIACAFAPTIKHLAEADLANSANGRADLITSVYYDGDSNAGNNWDNLTNYNLNDAELNAVVYYSVVWTANYWIVTYAFYHPRDYSYQGVCCSDNHENDMEGVMYVVDRATNQIVKSAAISHGDLLASCSDGNGIVSIDNRTHACRVGSVDGIVDINPCDDFLFFGFPHIVYTRGTISSQNLSQTTINDIEGTRHLITGPATYVLEDIFKIESNGLWNKHNIPNNGIFNGNTFVREATPGSTDCQLSGGLAKAPWGWDQFNHSNTHIDNLLSNQCSNLSSPMVHNPYYAPTLPICDYPQQVVAKQLTDVSILVDWEDIIGASSYHVYYKESSSGIWNIPITTTNSDYLIENLLPNTAYNVKVITSCNENYTYKTFTTTCTECACEKPVTYITSSQVLVSDKIDGDIIIQNGATLTINKETKFNIGTKILVEIGGKLIVTGSYAKLTSCLPPFKWQGVTLVGTPFYGQTNPYSPINGIIEMSNGAIIENAEVGINTIYTASSGNLGTYTWSGGIVRLNNAIIRNCTTGVKFGPYGQQGNLFDYEDASYISASSIENCTTGVILESNVGVDISESTISGIGEEGIKSINSKINITNCSITSKNLGIAFYNPWPSVYGSEINGSSFNNVTDIFSNSAGNASQNQINENIFNGATGIELEGLAQFNIKDNQFNGSSTGTALASTGSTSSNLIKSNIFNSNGNASLNDGINSHEYLSNCFNNTTGSNITLYGGSSIGDKQGNESDAASNCFYGSGDNITTGVSTSPFTYFIKNTTPLQDCKHPGYSLTGNYSVNDENNSSEFLIPCGSTFADYSTFRLDDKLPSTIDSLIILEKKLIKEIEKIEKDLKKTLKQKKEESYGKKKTLRKVEDATIIAKHAKEGRESAIKYASSKSSFAHKIMALSFIGESGDLSRTRKYLRSLPESQEQEIDFKKAQIIYLDYLSDKGRYKLSKENEIELKKIGLKENELSGFARSIYHVITNKKIYIKRKKLDKAETRSINDITENENEQAKANHEVTIYPNPLLSESFFVRVNLHHSAKEASVYNIEVYDLFGRKITNQLAKIGDNEVKLNNKGLYIVVVKENGRKIHTKKLSKI